ncbi:MAG: leucine-rich repeat domain-containing protein, partial [Treponema sp.]|nr:leucine-rich repeat domain-containing protein [Treponema sp.]
MKRKSCMVLRIGAAALLCFVMVFSSCDMLTGADGKDGNDGKDGGQAAAIYEKLTVSNAAALASGFAGLAEKYSPDDKIEATVTLAAGFDFAGLSAEIDTTVESFQITGTDPVNGLFTAIGADNIYVHYDFSASGWTGLDSGGDGVPFFLDTTDIGENADALAEVNLNAVRPHRNQILSIVMPAAIVAVGDYLFYDLQGLQKVSFAGCGNLTTINSYAFAAASFNNTALTDISFDGCTKLSYIGDYAFLYSANLRGSNGTTTLDLSAIDVPLLTIRDYAFFRAGGNGAMKSVKLPGGGWFGNNAFVRNMGLESVWITDGRWGEL